MARQLLPEASWRKTEFLTCRENFVGKNWSKSLEIDNSHWWKLKILIGGHLATLKWLVNCILKALGGILGIHCIWELRLIRWGPSSMKCSKNGCPCISSNEVWLKQLVNCFLKAHEGISYFSFRKWVSLVRINPKVDHMNTFWAIFSHKSSLPRCHLDIENFDSSFF